METFPANSLEGRVGELFPLPLTIACRSVREQSPFGIACISVLFSIKAAALCFKCMPIVWDWSWISEISEKSLYVNSVLYKSTLSSASIFRVFGIILYGAGLQKIIGNLNKYFWFILHKNTQTKAQSPKLRWISVVLIFLAQFLLSRQIFLPQSGQ